MQPWQNLSHIPVDRITDARLQLHWAAQIIASVGYSFIAPEKDWSHVSLSSHVSDEDYLLVSQPIVSAGGIRLGLRLANLSLVLLNDAFETRHTFALTGHRLEKGYEWLEQVVKAYLPADTDGRIKRTDHELPAHPVGASGLFDSADTAAFQLLAAWYANAEQVLQNFRGSHAGASPVRCWPHHFDLASLLAFDPDSDPEEGRSLGVGFIPGDSGYEEPYIYVTPWPYPENPTLTELPAGHWHQEGWFGAVLVFSEITAAEEQEGKVLAFTRTAIQSSKQFLGAR
ncbi:MAG: DUF5996 family protein [Rhodothermales bacterium]